MSRYLFGTPVLTISEVVNELNVAQGNVKQSHYASNLIHAKWVWKDLLWTNVWSLAQVVIDIVDGKIKLPNDVIRLVNISVMDKCGEVQPLGHNPYINTLDLRCPENKCGCACGGIDTYCQQVENITVKNEIVTIDGVDYPKTTFIRTDNKGNVYEIANIPTYEVAEVPGVVYIEQRNLLCKLDVTETGCVKATEPNRLTLTQFCGCYLPYGAPDFGYLDWGSPYWGDCGDWRKRKDCKLTVPPNHNDYGYYNWEAKASDVIHIKHTKATNVIISYQTSGESGNNEMLVPEYALDAMMHGIYNRQIQFAPFTVVSRAEKKAAKAEYQDAKNRLFEFNHPLRLDDFVKAQDIRPRW